MKGRGEDETERERTDRDIVCDHGHIDELISR